jgi:hypothetical protein
MIQIIRSENCPTLGQIYLCGKDVCSIFKYENPKLALQRYVNDADKKTLQQIVSKPLDHNIGKAVYITQNGVDSLCEFSKLPQQLKLEAKQTILTHINRSSEFPKMGNKVPLEISKAGRSTIGASTDLMDIFTFIRTHDSCRAFRDDFNSKWFQELWFPLSNIHLTNKQVDPNHSGVGSNLIPPNSYGLVTPNIQQVRNGASGHRIFLGSNLSISQGSPGATLECGVFITTSVLS